MDVRRLEEDIAARTIRAEAEAETLRLRQEASLSRQRAKFLEAARPLSLGEDDGGRWVEFIADMDPSGNRTALLIVGATVAAVVALPLFLWWSLWGLVPWLLLVVASSVGIGVWHGRERRVRVVVTPRGYWAMLVGGKVRHSGRVEDLRFVVGSYHASSACHGLRWVAVHGADGRLCESEQLVPGSGEQVRAFAEAVGAGR